jgi:type II restriction/modification system DNA methylase subunit YeeA
VTPEEFVAKWKLSELTERSAAQSHFIDLCRVLDEPAPTDADQKGEWYAFERGATKTTGGEGWADVWKRGHFGWEYKGRRKDLNAAFAQLQQYAIALENPPLLVVCDMERFRIHTNWTNSISQVHEFTIMDLLDVNVRRKLKWVFSDPERLRPGITRQQLTEDAAAKFAKLALLLRDRGHDPQAVAHFINRLIFCMFAEGVDLLPNKMFRRMMEHASRRPQLFEELACDLFRAMGAGGRIGFEAVDWFNGGLFDDDFALPLTKDDIEIVNEVASLDWAEIDPSILGTLFERGLDPDKRSQLGAHYTDREKIMMIIEPVIVRPWLAKWNVVKDEITNHLSQAQSSTGRTRTRARDEATSAYIGFLDRLRAFRVLDPACGSGNFLNLALLALKDLEHRVSIEAEAMGLQREFPQIGPGAVKGIEINLYAAELARVSVWIGEIQWMRRNGFGISRDPILKPLETIECRDAILNPDGSEPRWPDADVVIGNPPFLGDKKMVGTLGLEYVTRLRNRYQGRVAGNVDLVSYWFEKTNDLMEKGSISDAGLVATNAIRRGANRHALDRIKDVATIYDARSDERWVVDGAAVRVSLVCFGHDFCGPLHLDGNEVAVINADLTATKCDITKARKLRENRGVSFLGIQKSGPLDVPGDLARKWIGLPVNANNKPNSDILRPFFNGDDITGRWRDRWLIDFPRGLSESEAALFEAPFEYLNQAKYQPDDPDDNRTLREARAEARDAHACEKWWEPYWPRPELRARLRELPGYIVTPETPTYTMFAWLSSEVLPDKNLIIITKSDDTTFGILSSRFHMLWVRALGSPYGNHPTARRYNSSRVFDTFPFPAGLLPNVPPEQYAMNPNAVEIGQAAANLNALREVWLNPTDLVSYMPEVVESLPPRIVAVSDKAEKILKQRTLTNLYNENPTWLQNAHERLDAAVAQAYGWPIDISDDDALANLLALNQERRAQDSQ